jgi:hypothetical protein
VTAAFREQPLSQRQQLFGYRTKGPNLFATLPGLDDRQTCHHHVAMHIQPTASFIDHFHRFLSFQKRFTLRHERSKTGRGYLFFTSFICMLVGQYQVVRSDTWVHLGKQARWP